MTLFHSKQKNIQNEDENRKTPNKEESQSTLGKGKRYMGTLFNIKETDRN